MVRVGGPKSWARDVMRLSGPFAPCLGPTVDWGVACVDDSPALAPA